MTKKLILLFATCLLTTSCLFGCGDDTKPSDDNPTTTEKVETTTKEDVATTEPTTAEPTTQEPTTEEPSTEYVYKGMEYIIESVNKDYFLDLVVENGHVFEVNEFVDESENDVLRGKRAFSLVRALYQNDNSKVIEFESKYFAPGATVIEISSSENLVIKYEGNIKLRFYLVKDNGERAYFDVYEAN